MQGGLIFFIELVVNFNILKNLKMYFLPYSVSADMWQ